MSKRTIAARLAAVLAEVHRVPKHGRNNFHKYDYTTESDLTDFIRPLLAKHGLVIIPAIEEHKRDGHATFLRMSFLIMSEDGEQLGPFSWFGESSDKGDKGLYKAITGAVKYYLFKLFLVSTGDDPENEGLPHSHGRNGNGRRSSAKPLSEQDMIVAQVKELYGDYVKLLGNPQHAQRAMAKATGKKKSADYTEDDLQKLVDDLARRHAEANKGGTE